MFAFDPRRIAILLIGGDKTGDERFYERMIPLADRLYDEHMETLRKEDVLKEWASFEGSYVDRGGWLKCLFDALNRKGPPGAGKQRPFEPLYRAYKEGGGEAVVRAYRELKSGQAGEYLFDEMGLLIIADKLHEGGKEADAVPLADLCLEEYPQSGMAWYCHQILGAAHAGLGHRDLAVKSLRKSLELNPDNPDAAAKLKDLEK